MNATKRTRHNTNFEIIIFQKAKNWQIYNTTFDASFVILNNCLIENSSTVVK